MAKAKVIVFLCIIGLLALSSWVMTRRARRILSQSLGRDVRAGEESRSTRTTPSGSASTVAFG